MHGTQSLQRDLLEGGRELPSCVVDEDVRRPEPLVDGVEERLDLVRLPDVTGHREHVAAGGLQLGSRVLERLRPPAADRDARPGPGELAGRRPADARAPAGHDRDPTGVGVVAERGSELLYHARPSMKEMRVRRRRWGRTRRPGPRRSIGFGPGAPPPSRARLVTTDLGPDAPAADPPFPGRHVRRSRSRSVREAVERVRLRPRRGGRSRRDPRRRDSAARSSPGTRGGRWWLWSSPLAIPSVVDGAVLVDGGIGTLRETMDWATAKERLAPPHLAGMPVDEFRLMIRTFLGEAVEVTPEIEEIVLSVMHVDRRGRIRPRLSRANHFRILRAIWLHDPDAALARLSVPTLAVLARGGGDPEWDERKRRAAERAGGIGRARPDLLDGGDPRPAAAASGRARRAHRTFRPTARTMTSWPG